MTRCIEMVFPVASRDAFTLDDSLDDPRKVERTRREKETRKNSFIGHRDAASPFLATNTDFPRKNPLEEARVGKTATTRFFLEPCQSTRMDDERESMVSEREREREVERSASDGFEGIGKIVCRD